MTLSVPRLNQMSLFSDPGSDEQGQRDSTDLATGGRGDDEKQPSHAVTGRSSRD